MPSRHWLYFAGFVASAVLLVGVALLALLDALSVLSGGPPGGEGVVWLAMLGAAAEWVVAGLVLALLAVTFLLATLVSVLRSTSIPRSDGLAAVVERLERSYPLLRRFDASERVAPTTEDRRERLEERYVAGEISEAEFEREVERLLDDEEAGARSKSGTHSGLEREN